MGNISIELSNPLCRVVPIESSAYLPPYDKEKYKEMILDAAETVLEFLALIGLSTVISRKKTKWYEELKEQRVRDMETEMV
jgi:hypothetical protein